MATYTVFDEKQEILELNNNAFEDEAFCRFAKSREEQIMNVLENLLIAKNAKTGFVKAVGNEISKNARTIGSELRTGDIIRIAKKVYEL